MARKRLGETVIELKVITRDQLEQGLLHQRKSGERLGLTLVSLGYLTESQLCEALAKGLEISAFAMPPKQVDPKALRCLPASFCETHDLFPLAITMWKGRKTVMVAMADPLNIPAIEEISFRTGLHVTPLISPASGIRKAIQLYYHRSCDDELSSDISSDKDDMVIVRPGCMEQVVSSVPRPSENKPKVSPSPAPSSDDDRPTPIARLAIARPDEVEQLESKLWALLRVLTKKGLITPEELLRELEDQEK